MSWTRQKMYDWLVCAPFHRHGLTSSQNATPERQAYVRRWCITCQRWRYMEGSDDAVKEAGTQ